MMSRKVFPFFKIFTLSQSSMSENDLLTYSIPGRVIRILEAVLMFSFPMFITLSAAAWKLMKSPDVMLCTLNGLEGRDDVITSFRSSGTYDISVFLRFSTKAKWRSHARKLWPDTRY